MFELSNTTALVTGAMRGMGRTHALALSRQGARVVVTDIDLAQCQAVENEIRAEGGEAMSLVLDVSNSGDVDRAFTQAVSHFGRLDILINNAGIYSPSPALSMTEEEWEKVIHINLKGQFLCAQRAAKEMAKNNWGRIINITSIASGQVGVGIAGAAHYSASKGGIIGMTETLAIEFAPLGITVNAIAPGAIHTPMMDSSRMDPEALAHLLARIPLKRVGTPEEVSAAVVFLASREASYMTGATVVVDGGWLAN